MFLFGPALAGRSPTPLAAGKRRDFCQLRSANGASRRLASLPADAHFCPGSAYLLAPDG